MICSVRCSQASVRPSNQNVPRRLRVTRHSCSIGLRRGARGISPFGVFAIVPIPAGPHAMSTAWREPVREFDLPCVPRLTLLNRALQGSATVISSRTEAPDEDPSLMLRVSECDLPTRSVSEESACREKNVNKKSTGGLKPPVLGCDACRIHHAGMASVSSLRSRVRAVCRRRLIVPIGLSNLSLICLSDCPST